MRYVNFQQKQKERKFWFQELHGHATAIIEKIPTDDSTIEKVEMKKMGNAPDDKAQWFINIFIKN